MLAGGQVISPERQSTDRCTDSIRRLQTDGRTDGLTKNLQDQGDDQDDMTRDAKAEGPMTDAELIELLWKAYDLHLGDPYQHLTTRVPSSKYPGIMVSEGEDRWSREMDEVHAALRPHHDARTAAGLGLHRPRPEPAPRRPRRVRIVRGGLTGMAPGHSGCVLLEHRLRDDLARQLDGCTEPKLPYGRADIATETHAIEVEPLKSWRHGIRQALAYAAQCDLAPGLALFGAADAEDVLAMHLRMRAEQRSHGGPHVALWWHTGDARGWVRISARTDCRRMTEPTDPTREN